MNITNISQANCKDSVSTLNFTNDQLNAYNGLIEFINSPYEENDYKRALVGAAGTGKTYLVKALIKNCRYSYSTIGLSAPTHKACRVLHESIGITNIKPNTLQSDLGLRLNFDVDKFDYNNPPFDPKGRVKIGDYKLYIIDEASMINKQLCMFLEKTCKNNNCKIIYIGDSSQLAPVNEKYSYAFNNIKLFTLNQIVRQGEDNPISYLLDLLRFDIKHRSFTFLEYITKNRINFNEDNTKGYKVCTSQEFDNIVYNNFNDEALTNNIDFAKIIGYTNNNVSNWNKFVRNAIIKNSEEYILKDVVNYVHPKYQLKGFMIRFTAIHGGYNTTPLFVVDHKDIGNMMLYVKISNDLITTAKNANTRLRSQKWKEYYDFKENCLLLTNIISSDGKILFSRDLDYGFALTAHKSQGSTFDTTFVDVNDIVFDKYGQPYTDAEEINRRLYVACSRASNKLYLKYGK